MELPHATGALKDYLERLPGDSRIAVEATGNWMWLYELIEERHPDLVLAHPLKTKAIASARIKTDKINATTLAHLPRADLVPAAYIPPRAVRDTRELLRYRASLVRLRTQVKNKIAAIISKTGLQTPTRTACGVKSRRFLATTPVRPCHRLGLDGYLRTLVHLTTEIHQVATVITQQAEADPQAQILQTMPGIGAYSALLILSEIGDVGQFPDSRHLCSYAWLVPSVHASSGKTLLGLLTKQGASWFRWILVELSAHAINGAPQFRSLLSGGEKAWAQCGSGGGGAGHAQDHLCDADETGGVSPDDEGTPRSAPWGYGRLAGGLSQVRLCDCATGIPFHPGR